MCFFSPQCEHKRSCDSGVGFGGVVAREAAGLRGLRAVVAFFAGEDASRFDEGTSLFAA